MFPVDLKDGWEPVPDTSGIAFKPLSGDFDEAAGAGFRSRYIRFAPGGETFAPYTHTYWEESFLVEGSLTTKADGQTRHAPAYVIRPPGTPHGPLVSHEGCLLIEVQYFAERRAGPSAFLDGKSP